MSMDCYHDGCPFRVNSSSSLYRCECIACPNRTVSNLTYTTDNTTPEQGKAEGR